MSPANSGAAAQNGGPPMWQHPSGVVDWLVRHGQTVDPPVGIERIGTGQSNITTIVGDAAGRQWVMREPPAGDAPATAHDIAREARILCALASTGIPVPRVFGTGRGPSGSAFLVMEKAPGAALENEDDARRLDPSERRELGLQVAATLGRLHRLDPAILGVPRSTTPYLVRQLRRVTESWNHHGISCPHDADWQAVRAQLGDRLPSAAAPVVMHGDFRLSNLLVADSAVTAVLDWELCTIGDPMADLAWLLDDWRPPEEPAIVMPSPTREGGFPNRDEMIAAYRDVTGFDVDGIDYYRAFSQWRAASLLQGVLTRRRTGAMGTHAAVDLDLLDQSIAVLLGSAVQHLAGCR
jgi:aminoglycoside phosphotransferase (APT) family kinase protein